VLRGSDLVLPGSETMSDSSQQHGFSGSERSIVDEDEITLISVGVDIGSSTSHLVFSKLELERQNTRYVIVRRTILRESEILLTPYVADGSTIDAEALGSFIATQYRKARLQREEVDTGALILTGVAVLRRNARSIGELFAQDAGKFVAVSAGDGLEATMAAHGSGAVGESAKTGGVTMNIDIGGGTSKVAICQAGRVLEVTAIDVGARLIAFDDDGAVTRIEAAGRKHAEQAGVSVEIGSGLSTEQLDAIVEVMSDRLMEVVALADVSVETESLLRLPLLNYRGKVDTIIFSGGVSEFIYGHERRTFGDMGPALAREMKRRAASTLGAMLMVPDAGIRATVIGASQYTIQVSGSTIFISPDDIVPLRNIPVVTPEFDLEAEDIDQAAVSQALIVGLTRLDLADAGSPVAVGFRWGGSATYGRLDAFCKGLVEGLGGVTDTGHPIVLVSDGDIGGLLGLHLREEMAVETPLASIDGIDLREFDYIDIGAIIPTSGAVPVVIKSLVFPGSALEV
jgi:ethanolamine utilization protein EutA